MDFIKGCRVQGQGCRVGALGFRHAGAGFNGNPNRNQCFGFQGFGWGLGKHLVETLLEAFLETLV